MKVYQSYHMYFSREYTGKLDKYGGLPTHLPSIWPKDEAGDGLTFLCQIYCDGVKLAIPDTLCLQVYQWVENGEEGSDPIIVQVPIGAKENIRNEGICHPRLQEGDILFNEVLEEIIEERASKTLKDEKGVFLWDSKLRGWFCENAVTPDCFLGLIRDGDDYLPLDGNAPFNWGCGYNLVFYLDKSGKVVWDFF